MSKVLANIAENKKMSGPLLDKDYLMEIVCSTRSLLAGRGVLKKGVRW